MVSRRGPISVCALALACGAAATSCLGDDPEIPSSTPAEDASTTTPPADGSDARDGSVARDAAADAAADAPAPEKRFCSLADRDGGVDAGGVAQVVWSPQPPDSAGAPTVVQALTHGGCTLNVSTIPLTPPGQPPSTGILLHKIDTPAATCTEPKGFRLLGSTYGSPGVVVGHHSFDQRLFVVAYSRKNLSGGSPNVLNVAQYDFVTGDTLHVARLAVNGASFTPPGPSTAANVTIHGCNLVLRGSGTFAGAFGDGNVFSATYTGFVAVQPQPPSGADSASYIGP